MDRRTSNLTIWCGNFGNKTISNRFYDMFPFLSETKLLHAYDFSSDECCANLRFIYEKGCNSFSQRQRILTATAHVMLRRYCQNGEQTWWRKRIHQRYQSCCDNRYNGTEKWFGYPPGVAGIFVQEKWCCKVFLGGRRFVADTICINLPPSLVKQGAYSIRWLIGWQQLCPRRTWPTQFGFRAGWGCKMFCFFDVGSSSAVTLWLY